MKLASRPWLATALLATTVLVSACSDDDDGGNGPATPPAPTNVQAPAVTETSVSLTWNTVTGADSYVVQREVAAAPVVRGGALSVTRVFETVGTPATNAFTDETVTGGTTYNYRVAAVVDGTQGTFSTPIEVVVGAGPKVAIVDEDITADRTFFADSTYVLTGFIHVANGATLFIQPGTTIQGDFEVVGSSLFVLRGSRIEAAGTAEAPIVFTSERAAGQRLAGDWGGLIIVGDGIINRTGPIILEGTGTNTNNNYPVDYAGGDNNADDSGTLRYVRVEFGGYGPLQDAELNGLTMAAVGSGTTIKYVQVLRGLDDSFEWFGGAVDAKYLVSYESGDDHFDMSEGYAGRIQYAIAFQSEVPTQRPGAGNASGDPQSVENDGCNGAGCLLGHASTPFTQPLLANFTLVGPADGVLTAGSGGYGMVLRRGTAGYYVNGLVARFEKAAYSLRDTETANRVGDGSLILSHVVDAEVGAQFHAGQTGGTFDPGTFSLTPSALTAAATFLALPANPAAAGDFDWTPAAGSEATAGGMSPFTGNILTKAGAAVTATTYRGAVDPAGPKWWTAWTAYADN
ncbi:MAG TPA: fibronectin type III domain-containing protein [Gemmatimonadales bacterium]|nr:fibronectin type III domain-containing protein [Gemmatimonadales bacterium]